MAEPNEAEGQWKTKCPLCDCPRLLVIEVTLQTNSEVHHPGSVLSPDGFDVDPDGVLADEGIDDMSTDDEVVMCPKCRAFFTLADLANE